MDAIENPDHGAAMYDGVRVVNHPFNPLKITNPVSVAPAGGPNFPATEDAEISPIPS